MSALLTRTYNWEEQMVQFIMHTRQNGIICDWQHYNCASWVCDVIELMTGVDLYDEYRGLSKSPASAYQMIRAAGFKSLGEIVASKLVQKPNAFAIRGDVIMAPAMGISSVELNIDEEGALRGLMWDGPRSGSDPSFWESLGMTYATCLADPPFAWNLTEQGLVSLPLTVDCLTFDVGGLVCPQQ